MLETRLPHFLQALLSAGVVLLFCSCLFSSLSLAHRRCSVLVCSRTLAFWKEKFVRPMPCVTIYVHVVFPAHSQPVCAKSKEKKAFTRYAKKYTEGNGIADEKEKLLKHCTSLRLLCHTQIQKLNFRQKKAHICEIQVNGGSMADKIAFAEELFEKPVEISSVFQQNEMIDTIAITKGKGYEGVITRWGITMLPRKTHKGLRKVACIGSWHPSRVKFTVARAGQNGYHHRTEINKKVYKVAKGVRGADGKITQDNATTEYDLTVKGITPMGGFPHYGEVNEDYIMIKGALPGCRRRLITMRKTLVDQSNRNSQEEVTVKFIDTSSKYGHGRFQTADEKKKFMGPMKAKA